MHLRCNLRVYFIDSNVRHAQITPLKSAPSRSHSYFFASAVRARSKPKKIIGIAAAAAWSRRNRTPFGTVRSLILLTAAKGKTHNAAVEAGGKKETTSDTTKVIRASTSGTHSRRSHIRRRSVSPVTRDRDHTGNTIRKAPEADSWT